MRSKHFDEIQRACWAVHKAHDDFHARRLRRRRRPWVQTLVWRRPMIRRYGR